MSGVAKGAAGTAPWVDRLKAIVAGNSAPIPYDAAMGFRLVSWSPDGAVVAADVDGRFANPTGVLHGGVLMRLADSAMGLTVTGLLGEGQAGTNMDFQMRFLRPTKDGRLTDAAGKLVARASSAFLVLDAADFAKGRGPGTLPGD